LKERGKVFGRRVSPFLNYPYLILPCSLTISLSRRVLGRLRLSSTLFFKGGWVGKINLFF
jgi:hypothetical protein